MFDHYNWQELPEGSFLSRQKFCRNKLIFVLATKVFSQQAYFCQDKHTFVTTKDMFVVTNTCFHKTFITTKIILMAAPASDTS